MSTIPYANRSAAALLITLVTGCATDADAPARPDGTEAPAVLSLTDFRDDLISEITPETGTWGTWGQSVFCNPGTYAVGFTQRVERSVGDKDDTSLNAVRLLCANRARTRTETILSDPGLYGDWSEEAICAGFVNGGRVKFEPPQGSGDDTAANGVQLSCTNGTYVSANNDGRYGNYGFWQSCPDGSAVCGISTRNEASQGGGDDSAMNGLRLYCCAL